jgi:hypothetical protein
MAIVAAVTVKPIAMPKKAFGLFWFGFSVVRTLNST